MRAAGAEQARARSGADQSLSTLLWLMSESMNPKDTPVEQRVLLGLSKGGQKVEDKVLSCSVARWVGCCFGLCCVSRYATSRLHVPSSVPSPCPLPPQTNANHQYSFLVRWLDQFGEAFLQAIQKLEARWPAVTAHSFNDLRALLTEEARVELFPTLGRDDLTPSMLREKVELERRKMWLRWHWQLAPDSVLHPTRSMPAHPAGPPLALQAPAAPAWRASSTVGPRRTSPRHHPQGLTAGSSTTSCGTRRRSPAPLCG